MKLTDFCSLKILLDRGIDEEKLCLLLFVDALVVVAHIVADKLLKKVSFQVPNCGIEMLIRPH